MLCLSLPRGLWRNCEGETLTMSIRTGMFPLSCLEAQAGPLHPVFSVFSNIPPFSLFLATFSSCVHHHLLFLASFPSTLCLTSPGKVTTELTEHLDMKDCDQHLNGALRWLVAPLGDASFYHAAFLKHLVFDLF